MLGFPILYLKVFQLSGFYYKPFGGSSKGSFKEILKGVERGFSDDFDCSGLYKTPGFRL